MKSFPFRLWRIFHLCVMRSSIQECICPEESMMMEPNARLLLDFKRKSDGKTYISHQFFKLPLQVFPPFYPEDDGTACVYLLNPSSGMLEGDYFEMRFCLKNKAAAVITTPSANKIYRSNGRSSVQEIYAEISEGCCLEFIPEHNVPYKDSRFFQRSEFHVERGGTLLMWDCVVPGRLARNECFDFTEYRSDISIFYGKRLIIHESANIRPSELAADSPAVMADYMIFSTVYLVCEHIPDELLTELRAFLAKSENVHGGASCADENLLVIKILMKSTLHINEFSAALWDIVRKHAIGKPAFKIRKY
ncbi:MAG: urease accessory protein UreD [Oscillospiraceae bacterium]